jgi:hypothetical protein
VKTPSVMNLGVFFQYITEVYNEKHSNIFKTEIVISFKACL